MSEEIVYFLRLKGTLEIVAVLFILIRAGFFAGLLCEHPIFKSIFT